MTSTHDLLYSQQSFRDGDGDIFIKQFAEDIRPSGLIVPRTLGFASVQSAVTSAEKFNQSPSGLIYSASSEPLVYNEIESYAVAPVARPVFRKLSGQAIVGAVNKLDRQDLKPTLRFGSEDAIDAMQEDERALLEGIMHDVAAIIRGDTNAVGDGSELPTGQYL